MRRRYGNMVLEAIRSLLRKPETLPSKEIERKIFTEESRGIPTLIADKCIGCSLCAMTCPSQAITMIPGGKRSIGGRVIEIKIPSFDYSKCIYCELCAQICKPNAIEIRKDQDPIIIMKNGESR
ncbi:MAG: 4Fe-4S binding protein [Sulfolobales archaeon]